MMLLKCGGAVFVTVAFSIGITTGAFAAPPQLACASSPTREAFAIPTPQSEAGFNEFVFSEVKAGDSFSEILPHGWRFVLLPTAEGWAIRLFDRESLEGRVDLTAITPPHYGVMNPRNIAGWHFRNAANTGPNEGDVNAPQSLRMFQFSTGLIGTGGFRAPRTNSIESALGKHRARGEAGFVSSILLSLNRHRGSERKCGR